MGEIKSLLKDGVYQNLFDGEMISIQDSKLQLVPNPIIIKSKI